MTEEKLKPVDLSTLPHRTVTRSGFRQAALTAGWDIKTVTLFLDKRAPVRKPFKVGDEALTIQDWDSA